MVEINKDLAFPNGTFIFRKNGTQIDPKEPEGKLIVAVLKLQEEIKSANREQKEKWIITTYPRDKVKQNELRKQFGLI